MHSCDLFADVPLQENAESSILKQAEPDKKVINHVLLNSLNCPLNYFDVVNQYSATATGVNKGSSCYCLIVVATLQSRKTSLSPV